ncbi:MAG: hypothetical protein U0M06_09015, partial [Clostridia bacterium]|nr:hypothetical protein [Clostridia bacterium]
MKKTSKALENIKTVLVILLFITSLIIVSMHFVILKNKNESAGTKSNIGSSLNLRNDGEAGFSALCSDAL